MILEKVSPLSFQIRVPENLLQFEGQTKEKLGTPVARTLVDNVIGEQMGFYLQENSEMSQMLVRKAVKAREAREAARKAREESRNGKKRKGIIREIDACAIT